MSVKREHVHSDGRVCYSIHDRNGHRFSGSAVVRTNGKEFTVAHMGFTGHWYAFDPKTGREIGSFTREFYEDFIAPLAVELVPDPDCLVNQKEED